MLVVADTTPLNYLILIDHVDILPPLYGQVIIPQAVSAELLHPRAPARVRAWVAALPPWCTLRHAQGPPDPALMSLGAGEREALLLVQELGADVLLTDDLEGREEALHRGMQVTGTLGILERAALRDLIDLPTAITRLQATTFYPPEEIIAAMLAHDAARKSRPPPDTRRGRGPIVVR
jgi:predicted nucleic acid-binding protein